MIDIEAVRKCCDEVHNECTSMPPAQLGYIEDKLCDIMDLVMEGRKMRTIDADTLIKRLHETAFKDSDDRQIVYNAIDGMLSIDSGDNKVVDKLKAHVEYLSMQNENLRGQIRALAFAVRCNGVSGNEVGYYEVD